MYFIRFFLLVLITLLLACSQRMTLAPIEISHWLGEEPIITQPTHTIQPRKIKSFVKPKQSIPTIQTTAAAQWSWPAQGAIISSFNPNNGQKGVDIVTPKGTLVHAAYNGSIVYSGHGLPGYGNLIIIKHPNNYLTAYANNTKNLVHEGEHVVSGQIIAEVGLLKNKRLGLHFELRKNGNPINPCSLKSIQNQQF